MKAIKVTALVLLLAGCDRPQQHMWTALEICEQTFNEPCSFAVVPDSKRTALSELMDWPEDASEKLAKLANH